MPCALFHSAIRKHNKEKKKKREKKEGGKAYQHQNLFEAGD